MNVIFFPCACEFLLPSAHVFFQSHVNKGVKKFVKKIVATSEMPAEPRHEFIFPDPACLFFDQRRF